MLTGPVTMLQWSFVRDDQPRSATCEQLALAIRDEVEDLEAEDIKVIQVDEPAIREGLPLRRDRWDEYLEWAVYSFRVATTVVRDETQIHTHMCYSEFGDIMEQIQQMDADVNSDRGGALAHGAAPRLGAHRLRAGDRPRRLRHPLAARPLDRGDGRAARRPPQRCSTPSRSGSTPTAA